MGSIAANGVTTDPEVRALHQTYPLLTRGQTIPYEDIARIIGCAVGSHRWGHITRRWRNQVFREQHLFIGCMPGSAFVVLSESERLDVGIRKGTYAMRSLRRSATVVAGTDTTQLTPEERQRQTHTVATHARLLTVWQEQQRSVETTLETLAALTGGSNEHRPA